MSYRSEIERGVEEAEKARGTAMLRAWADLIGVAADDERVIYGWPEKFLVFKAGWEASKIRAAEQLLTLDAPFDGAGFNESVVEATHFVPSS